LDFNNVLADLPDPYGETPGFAKFTALINEIWN
jgi:hypothetical protein